MIITNERHATTRDLINRCARRMTSEQRLGEIIRAFCADALSSTVNLNVGLDIMLTVLARALLAALRPTARLRHRHPRDRPRPLPGNPRKRSSPATTPSPWAWNAAPAPPSYALPTCPPRPPYPGSGTELSATNSPETPLRRTSCVEIRANLARVSPVSRGRGKKNRSSKGPRGGRAPVRRLAPLGGEPQAWSLPGAGLGVGDRNEGRHPQRSAVDTVGASASFCRAGRG